MFKSPATYLFWSAALMIFLSLGNVGCTCLSGARYTLAQAEMVMQSDPGKSLEIIESIDGNELSGSHDRALYSLLYSQALDKNYIDLTTDSIITTAVAYYSEKNNHLRRAQAYYYLGRVQYNAREMEPAMESFLEAKESAVKSEDYLLSGQIYSILGKLHYEQLLLLEAHDLYKEAAVWFFKAAQAKRAANALSYAGKCSYMLGKDSAAIALLNDAIAIYQKQGCTLETVLNICSIAGIMINGNEVDKALELLENVSLSYRINPADNFRFYPLLSKIYKLKNEFEKAEKYAYITVVSKETDQLTKAGALLMLKELALTNREYEKSKKYDSLYLAINNNIVAQREESHLVEIQARYSKEQLEESYRKLNSRYNRTSIIFAVIIFLAAAGTIALYRYHKRRSKEIYCICTEEAQALESTIRKLEQNLSLLEREFTDLKEKSLENDINFIASLKLRIDYIKELLDVAYISSERPEKFYSKFREYTEKMNRNKSSNSDIIFIANRLNNGIIDHLKKNTPSLTRNELLYCSLISLGFSANAIRLLNGHTNQTSTYNTRSKINKKLGISNMKLETYLKQLNSRL